MRRMLSCVLLGFMTSALPLSAQDQTAALISLSDLSRRNQLPQQGNHLGRGPPARRDQQRSAGFRGAGSQIRHQATTLGQSQFQGIGWTADQNPNQRPRPIGQTGCPGGDGRIIRPGQRLPQPPE